MPYSDESRNRRRVVRAILSGLMVACLLLLLVLAPPRILAWSGLSFGSLTVPALTVAAVDEPVARAMATMRTPPMVAPLTFPAYADWKDLEATCTDCDSSLSYGIGGYLDAVDNEALGRLERASGVGPGTAGSQGSGSRGTASGVGGTGGGPLAAGSASPEQASAQPAGGTGDGDTSEGDTSESSGDLETADATTAGSETAGSESSAPGASGAPRAANTTPDLILSRITPSDEPAGDLPQDVVRALLDSPVGSETVHSGGEPELISEALSLEDAPAASTTDGGLDQVVPEPVSLLLVGLGLSASVWRRRATR